MQATQPANREAAAKTGKCGSKGKWNIDIIQKPKETILKLKICALLLYTPFIYWIYFYVIAIASLLIW